MHLWDVSDAANIFTINFRILRSGAISDMWMWDSLTFLNRSNNSLCKHTNVCISLMICAWDVEVLQEWTFPRRNHLSSWSSSSSSSSSSPWSTQLIKHRCANWAHKQNRGPALWFYMLLTHLISNIDMLTEPTSKIRAWHPNSTRRWWWW